VFLQADPPRALTALLPAQIARKHTSIDMPPLLQGQGNWLCAHVWHARVW